MLLPCSIRVIFVDSITAPKPFCARLFLFCVTTFSTLTATTSDARRKSTPTKQPTLDGNRCGVAQKGGQCVARWSSRPSANCLTSRIRAFMSDSCLVTACAVLFSRASVSLLSDTFLCFNLQPVPAELPAQRAFPPIDGSQVRSPFSDQHTAPPLEQ